MEQYLPAAVAIAFLVVFGVAVAVGVRQRRRQMRAFAAALSAGGRYVARPAGLASVVATTHPAPLMATLTLTTSGGKNSRPLWRIVVEGVGLGDRTTLSLGRDGVVGGWLKKLLLSDVEVGDPSFDDRFLVLGSDRDVIRGVMAAPEVRAAIGSLFLLDVWGCHLNKRGRLEVKVRRASLSEQVASDALDATKRLAEALHAQTEAKALSPPLDDKVQSAGAGSGAPVGIRTASTTGRKR